MLMKSLPPYILKGRMFLILIILIKMKGDSCKKSSYSGPIYAKVSRYQQKLSIILNTAPAAVVKNDRELLFVTI